MNRNPISFSDDELVSLIRNGDHSAFETVFRSYYSILVVMAVTIIHDRAEAENLVQDLFVRLWEKRSELRVGSLKSYLYVAVRNGCFNAVKHATVERKYFDGYIVDDVEKQGDERECSYELLYDVVNQMPAQRRRIFMMSRFEGKKYAEIAQLLNLSPKTIESQMGKALMFLRGKLLPLRNKFFLFLLFILG